VASALPKLLTALENLGVHGRGEVETFQFHDEFLFLFLVVVVKRRRGRGRRWRRRRKGGGDLCAAHGMTKTKQTDK